MQLSEFDDNDQPVSRKGMSSVEAVRFLQNVFPEVQQWTAWRTQYSRASWLLGRLPVGTKAHDRVGSWAWKQLPCPYPVLPCWPGGTEPVSGLRRTSSWTGAIEVVSDCGARFILFSWLAADGMVGSRYLASTTDLELLERFIEDLEREMRSDPSQIRVRVFGGSAIDVPVEDEVMVLPQCLQSDIECQVRNFFQGASAYAQHRIPHRRGFLFVGPPGNGKTLMIRQLIRLCHREFKAAPCMLRPSRGLNEDTLDMLFTEVAARTPAIVIFEDMDTLTRETNLTRAGLLAQFDGLGSRDGVLIIGTTNNPGDIDPALVHRPSRFDRVWHFKLPDAELRTSYLAGVLPSLEDTHIRTLSKQTHGWSFAYLNELRTTAIMMSITDNGGAIEPEIVEQALELLGAQFQAGEKNHTVSPGHHATGFAA